ncbi:unnamed protein product [Rangifer tarandus platyrhynchus]|uniref:Uncharacterized protein n=1 Tax=Rangifer tarandus platyrhynchus TaxID=3082113 RepID=A0ABN8ZB11_RANTA|nr:unnamed protein product [Rangifer tarandus platyrhynchus]
MKATTAACKIHEEKERRARTPGAGSAPQSSLQPPASPAGAVSVLVTPRNPSRPPSRPAGPSRRPRLIAPGPAASRPQAGEPPQASCDDAGRRPPPARRAWIPGRAPPPGSWWGRAGVGRQRPPPAGAHWPAARGRPETGAPPDWPRGPVMVAPIGWGGPRDAGWLRAPASEGLPLVRF